MLVNMRRNMRSKTSTVSVTPAPSHEILIPLCDPCVNQQVEAKAWCGTCGMYLCRKCTSSHFPNHRLTKGRQIPQTRPDPDSRKNNYVMKVLSPLATMVDNEAIQDGTPLEDRCIRGCVCVRNYVITITSKHLTLYDDNFCCIGDIDYKIFHPNSISSRGDNLVVSFERTQDKHDQNPKDKGPVFVDIQTYTLKLPSCRSDIKLVKGKGFTTVGQCFTTAVCAFFDKHLNIAVGLKLDSHPIRDDIEYIVQIIKADGKVLQTLEINPLGEPCFTSEFFLCATMKLNEIAVTEVKLRQIRGIYVKTGKTVFQFNGGFPQGIICDNNDNILVYNEGQLYWIPPLRNKIHYMQQGYHNKRKPKRDMKMAVSIAYNDEQHILYKSCIDKHVIETFTVTG